MPFEQKQKCYKSLINTILVANDILFPLTPNNHSLTIYYGDRS